MTTEQYVIRIEALKESQYTLRGFLDNQIAENRRLRVKIGKFLGSKEEWVGKI